MRLTAVGRGSGGGLGGSTGGISGFGFGLGWSGPGLFGYVDDNMIERFMTLF